VPTAAATSEPSPAAPSDPPAAPSAPNDASSAAAGPSAAGDLSPVPLEAGAVALTPENTRIQFIGTHVGERPDPRIGTFQRFTGKLEADSAAKSLKSVQVEIEVDSIQTEFGKLTNHLKSPDFLEARQYPMASFQSTSIAPGSGEGQWEITGNLTLHGVTKEIRFPATVSFADGGFTLRSEFAIHRSEFGMTWGQERVHDKVAMTVTIGQRK
jgi:polyisoprenoid-binding protein YceI